MKKRIDIEKLLKWAYCEELPKAFPDKWGQGMGARSAWQSMETYAQLLTRVDENRYGVVPILSELEGEPHADALKVHAAVRSLGIAEICLPDGWHPMPEIAKYEAECKVALQAAFFGIKMVRPAELVQKHAILGGCPDWRGEAPEIISIKNRNGQDIWFRMTVQQGTDADGYPVEYRHESEDGWCRVQKAPKRGAYRKFRFDPDPVPSMISRGEYVIWRSCLIELVEKLQENMELWQLEAVTKPLYPWDEGGAYEPRVLEALEKNY